MTSTTASGRNVASTAVKTVRAGGGTRAMSSSSGSLVAAPIRPPSAPHTSPSANALPTDGEMFVNSVSPPKIAKTSINRPNGTPTAIAQPNRAGVGAPSVRYSCLRVVRISAVSGIAEQQQRADPAPARDQQPRVDHRRQQGPDRVAEALGDDVDLDADAPEDRTSGVMTAISSPAARTTAAEMAAAMTAAMIPDTTSRGGGCGRGGTAGSSSCG